MVEYCFRVKINKKFEFCGQILYMYLFLIRIYLKNYFWQELRKSESLCIRPKALLCYDSKVPKRS
jgi:hypothetical protein